MTSSSSSSSSSSVKYGELVVIGSENKLVASKLSGRCGGVGHRHHQQHQQRYAATSDSNSRRCFRFELFRQQYPTAVMPSRSSSCPSSDTAAAIVINKQQQQQQPVALISFKLGAAQLLDHRRAVTNNNNNNNNNNTKPQQHHGNKEKEKDDDDGEDGDNVAVVSFTSVLDKDMFQIGRAASIKNDVQLDVPTISRYACRIVISREPPYTARIYAGAFDDKNHIFLGANATITKMLNNNNPNKSAAEEDYDALITNGILLWQPPAHHDTTNNNSGNDDDDGWREVSVSGRLFKCKKHNGRAKPDMTSDDALAKNESNQLVDGSIIDVGGILLLWRSHQACLKFDDEQLGKNVMELNAMHNVCPVEMQTLILKMNNNSNQQQQQSASSSDNNNNNNNSSSSTLTGGITSGVGADDDPYAFVKCGHVVSRSYQQRHEQQGTGGNNKNNNNNFKGCPTCRDDSDDNVLIRLKLGSESRLYIAGGGDDDGDNGLPTYFFKSCGHVASEKTVKYWSKVPLGINAVDTSFACPFCLTPLQSSLQRIASEPAAAIAAGDKNKSVNAPLSSASSIGRLYFSSY